MGTFGYVACCFALFAFCTADLVAEGRNDVVTPFEDYAARLIGGPDQTQGRFELAIDGVWGTVCDEGFSDIDAEVACFSLGFDQNQGTFLGNTFGPGTEAIHFSDIECIGTELAIDDCPHSPLGDVGRCDHNNDISISCVGVGGYPVRLTGGFHPYEGLLEIQYQGIWGTVCNDNFFGPAVQVACNSLGLGNQGYVVVNTFTDTNWMVIHLDDVDCTGDETNIGYCAHAPWGVHNCVHTEDVALSCSSLDVAARLTGGATSNEGRLEFYLNGEWGTVCDSGFRDTEAQVACNNLGFDAGQGTFLGNQFGPGTGVILIDNVVCDGTEPILNECRHSAIGATNCTHDNDVSISCVGSGYPVRLVGGFQPYEGRLEIQHQGTWGTVCSNDFTNVDIQVACNSLGLGNEGYVVINNFGETTGVINLDEVDCTGDETNIGYCAHDPWGVHDCQHIWDIAISCSSLDVAARLTGGATPNEGRLEFLSDRGWGTVCDSGFRDIEAQVACNNLGFDAGLGTFLGNQFGPGTGEILLDNVVCDGTEPILNECQHSSVGVNNCTHDNDVSISCVGSGYDVRLVGGTEFEGRVEVFHLGEWGTICPYYMTNNAARVVCNTLGFGYQGYTIGSQYGPGTGKIWLDEVQCLGNEPNVGNCVHRPWGLPYYGCSHSMDISVTCTPADVAVRLVGGTNGSEGRFEAYRFDYATWGTVCGTGFGETEASVACLSLGFDQGEGTYLGNQFGPGSGNIIFDNVNCTGSEYTLDECQHSPIGHDTDCTHDQDVSISCVGSGYPLRLVDGFFPTDGRLEIFYRGEWGAVCSTKFTDTEAKVACRALGYGQGIGRYTGNNEGTVKIWLDYVQCEGWESNIGHCSHNIWGETSCSNGQHTEISCSTSTGVMYPVRLIGSDGFQAKSSGRLEYFIDDQWGTVCDPTFNDTDAQVACYSLGFNQFEGTYIGQMHGSGTGDILVDDVLCTGDEVMIDDCPHSHWGVANCDHTTDVSIQCVGPWPANPVRLVDPFSNSNNPTAGRLEIQYYGSWGTVCDEWFTDIEASVACASLGFGYIGSVLDPNPFGPGTGKTFLVNVKCNGDELSIANCAHEPWNTVNCGHAFDVAISCVV